MNTSLLSTKLYKPIPRPDLIARPQLLTQLTAGLTKKLSIICAPAGYGKTTLLSAWLGELEISAAWLSLDEEDNDIASFYDYLVAALQTVTPKFSQASPSLHGASGPPPINSLLISLINDVSDFPGKVLLILDDYHTISGKEIHQLVAFLLDNLPANMHVMIASRSDPPIRLANLRAKGELSEIRAEDLRFTQAEADAYLNQSLCLGLNSADISTLVEKTEGWIAGLQLVAISLQGNPDKEAFIRDFSGDDRYIADYLLDEALDRQPHHVKTFLLQTSILDKLSSPLCNAVTRRNDSQEILEMLDRSNLFLVPLDNQRKWYRYHRLFTDLLLLRLNHLSGSDVESLYQRASLWYEQENLFAEAARLALLGGDAEKVSHLMEGHMLAIISSGALAFLNQQLSTLPARKIDKNPWLGLAQAWGLAFTGQLDRVEALLVHLENSLIEQSIADNTLGKSSENFLKRIQGRIFSIRSYIADARGDIDGAARHAGEALKLLPDSELAMKAYTLSLIGETQMDRGDLEAAISTYSQAVRISEATGDIYLTIMLSSRLVTLSKMIGQLSQALNICEQLIVLGENHQRKSGHSLPVLAYAKLRMSGVLYERNELEAALTLTREGLEMAKQWGRTDAEALGYYLLVRILMAMGQFDQALAELQILKRIYQLHYFWFLIQITALEARIAIRNGNLVKASQWVEANRIRVDDDIDFRDVSIYLTFAIILIAQGKFETTVMLLDKLLSLSSKTGALQLTIQILASQATVYHLMKQDQMAIVILERALSIAEPEGFIRAFIDHGEPMMKLLYQAALQGKHPEFCNQILGQFSTALKPDHSSPANLIEPLSSREREILQVIAEGCSNQEISQRLHISLATVKSHIHHIFGKLGVKNRTEAVAKARLLGILPPS